MRRLSLALALLGAVAAGCSGGDAPGSSGTSAGSPGSTFTVFVRGEATYYDPVAFSTTTNIPRGGVVTSIPAGIDCGTVDGVVGTHNRCSADFAWDVTGVVTLQVASFDADPDHSTLTANASQFYAFAGSCVGANAPCKLTGNSDKFVLVRFASTSRAIGIHPNFSDGRIHGREYMKWKGGTGAYACAECHGNDLKGAGLALGCNGCHSAAAMTFFLTNTAAVAHDWANGAFTTMFAAVPAAGSAAAGPAVTAACNACHPLVAQAIMATQHWTWAGPTPQLFDVGSDFLASALGKNPGNIGKANLINNYCVAVGNNEKRCDQCHAGYGNPAGGVPANSGVSARTMNDPNRVDCLICHAQSVSANMAAGGYNKIAGAYGGAGSAVSPGTPWATQAQLTQWSAAVQKPSRENCGWCHFNGGGADSVKIMGTQLRVPADSTDVHMGTTHNMNCADCHASENHTVKGAGVHVPTNTARTSCESCHGTRPHGDIANHGSLDAHTDTVACQTCHIPAFSRAMPQKTDWDWATAGYKNIVSGGTIYACVPAAGGAMVPYGTGCATGFTKVKAYDFMKGTFLWAQNVQPSYAWYNGKMTHVTTDDKGVFGAMGTTPANRITLSQPLGGKADPTAKIFPFKIMTGRQAVYVADATAQSFIIAPKLFMEVGGDGGFWGTIAGQPPGTVHGYSYTPAAGEGFDALGAPSLPLDGSFVVTTNINGYAANTSYPFSQLLGQIFTLGASSAAQYDPAVAGTMARWDGTPTGAGWDWRYTQMYLDLEHEVAPKEQALGYNHGCSACHQPYSPGSQNTAPTAFMQAVGYDADPGYVTTARRTE